MVYSGAAVRPFDSQRYEKYDFGTPERHLRYAFLTPRRSSALPGRGCI